MEVVYNVKYKFKKEGKITKKELMEVLNNKLLNIIFKLENQKMRLNNY